MLKHLVLLLLLGNILFQTDGKDLYLITTPKMLLTETTHEFSAFVTTNVALTIETIHKISGITNRSSVIILKKGFQSFQYVVPFIGQALGKTLELRFLGDKCSTIVICKALSKVKGTFIKKNYEIMILNQNYIIFSETDKPIYKPGDIVRLRVMAIFPANLMLEPSARVLFNEIIFDEEKYKSVPMPKKRYYNIDSITIESPYKVKMALWLNVSFSQAMNMKFQLSKDPTFGKWKVTITLGLQKEIFHFIVKKYVLPRFVVELYPPSVTLITDSSISVKVCASYSTGKNIEALIKGEMCTSEMKERCNKFESTINKKSRCVVISMKKNSSLLESERYLVTEPSFIRIRVTENGTTHRVTKTASLSPARNTLYEIKFKGKDYFKPGLPYFGTLMLQRHDGSPQSNTRVEINVQANYDNKWGFEKKSISNEEGIVEFVIPYIHAESDLNVYITGEKIDSRLTEPKIDKLISKWYSEDNEYIQISSLKIEIKCPGTVRLRLIMNSDVSKTKLLSQTFSRGLLRGVIEHLPVNIQCKDRDDYLGHYKCATNNQLKCLEGWGGPNCREPLCKDGCVNGICLRPNHCACKNGWVGKFCEQCKANSNCIHGYCRYGNDCHCKSGWKGIHCNKKGPKVHKYIFENAKFVNTTSWKPEPTFQRRTIFERDLDILISKSMGPDLHIVVFYVNKNGEVISDSIEIGEGLSNCSHLSGGIFEFDRKISKPGDTVQLTLDPGTLDKSCALNIRDIALSQFGQSSNVNLDYLVKKLTGLNHKVIEDSFHESECLQVCERHSFIESFDGKGYDSQKIFFESGMLPITNARIILKKCVCDYEGYEEYLYSGEAAVMAPKEPHMFDLNYSKLNSKKRKNLSVKIETTKEKIKERIREFFPDSWVFDYYNVTPSKINLAVPDSVTSWEANSFCMTEKGIWISPIRKLTVILPFFADIYLPYSIKIGEILQLPVKLFNYIDDCYEIKTELIVNSSEIKITGPRSFTFCVCTDEAKTIYFNIMAKIMGTINITVSARSRYSEYCSNKKIGNKEVKILDTIRRQLLVEPPGIQSETTFSELICNNKEQFGLKTSHHIPTKIVPGSLRTYLVFNGDAMGQTFDNLDRLVQMPYGCGEQNMVALVPSIYVLEYLSNLKIKDPILETKAKRYISEGYKRQLTYKHDDGSYSAFGKNDKSGSTWLTAFVLRSFTDASKYVSIDKNVLKDSIRFLERMQSSNGCFKENGKLLRSTMAGGLKNKGKTDEGLLTAYVLIGLKRVKIAKSIFNTLKALKCVQIGLKGSPSTYRMAISAYTLSLYDPISSVTTNLLHKLRNTSYSSGRYRYWRSGLDTSESFGQFNSADIETSGYALLALQNFQTLPESLATIYWLSNQRNSLGGYYSTQDTIVALNSIAVFAEKVGVTSFERLDLEVVLDETERYNGSLTKQDRLVTRKINLGSRNISYVSIKTNGTGCVAIQLISLYNIEKLFSAEEEFKIDVKATFVNKKVCTILKVEVCSSYLRTDRDSNMILITIDFPSGWELTNSEKDDLLNLIVTPLKRIDFMKEKMHLYYDSFSYDDESKEICFKFKLQQKNKIDNLKSSFVRMVDYYKPEIYTDISYSVPMKSCQIFNNTKPKPPKQILCPKCFNDSKSSFYQFQSKICPWAFAALVNAGSKTLKGRILYESKAQMFNEWSLDLEPYNCSCLQLWPHIHDSFIILSSSWLRLEENVTLTNESVLFPVNLLYSAFKSDLGNSCSSAYDLSMMASRLIPDFRNRTSVDGTCAPCILLSNIHHQIRNISSFICSKKLRWSLNIESLKDDVIKGTLSKNINETIAVEASFPMSTCFCLEKLKEFKKSFVIVDLKDAIPRNGDSLNSPFKLVLDDNFYIVHSSIFSSYSTSACIK